MKGKRNIYAYAFEKSFPVMVGYLFLGAAYGILMETGGYGIGWALAMSVFVYAGSLQYASIPMLAASVHPLYAFLMAIMINARHLFYGISMLGKYHDTGRKKPYLIFSLTDETFSVVCDEKVPEYMNPGKLYFLISLFDQSYWVLGTLMGCVIGSFITFNSSGLDFALTALFVVIFTSQWMEQKNHAPAITGVAATFLCLQIFGEEFFIIPSMIVILVILIAGYFHTNKKDEDTVSGEEINYGE
ncbi:MAG: AzlC family ABC transporter permease [Lachnospiraceae bacterium]|jgi:4-azaleucine resistance transporter AzlC|nr:AzlC family ABC transporter permease [Lachnospiraceae bacterium]MDD3617708.1 AzlC family ABC transporter permease [Lachnospiraceae bacterium]